MEKSKVAIRIRKEAEAVLRQNSDATIDDLIDVCVRKGIVVRTPSGYDDEIVFEAIAGTKYSTLYEAKGF